MTYKDLIRKLRKQAKSDGCYEKDVTLTDLLDDLGTAGVEGASDLYLRELKSAVAAIDPETGNVSER